MPVALRVFTEPQQGASYDDLLRVARAAEDLGYDGVWANEHHFHPYGGFIPSPPVMLAGWNVPYTS